MLLELTPDVIQQLRSNLAATTPLNSNTDISHVTFHFPTTNFIPLGDEPDTVREALEELTNTANLQVIHGNVDTTIDDTDGYLILSLNTSLGEDSKHGATFYNTQHVIPFNPASFKFAGEIEHYDMNNWMTANDLYESDLDTIQETYDSQQATPS